MRTGFSAPWHFGTRLWLFEVAYCTIWKTFFAVHVFHFRQMCVFVLRASWTCSHRHQNDSGKTRLKGKCFADSCFFFLSPGGSVSRRDDDRRFSGERWWKETKGRRPLTVRDLLRVENICPTFPVLPPEGKKKTLSKRLRRLCQHGDSFSHVSDITIKASRGWKHWLCEKSGATAQQQKVF